MSLALSVLALLAPQAPQEAAAPTPVASLRAEAERVLALVECAGTKAFLAATSALPEVGTRVVAYDAKTREARTADELAALPEAERARFEPASFGPDFYYTTRSGSPLAYARALDVIGKLSAKPTEDALSGKRILDFGFGGIGHLRLLASLGCDAVGVDVDPLLHAYYRAEDQGAIAGVNGARAGKLTLVHGRFPAEERVRNEIGTGFDLVLSKNTLKKGYVRPAQKVDPRMLVDLGVAPERFLPEVARVLKPGGIFALYNICPAPRADRYIPWAYGESPFTKEEFAAAGFELLAFDVDDTAALHELAYALKWDEQGMTIEGDTFAWYTLARKVGA
ncbi:MAG: methyltransferase domain-containing protein [Planctomycetes bacterium]|nr:methyltransferase domain-containing protein [Planctomycetota bacterium]